ncbi:hypothetical protein V6N13_043019 [Hibiscus sabdariffa]|uniref:AP2/ERF domain-containing protein n=1 Tax=Hibiscus sabdariffa TaxID=183260 RepID=A0ABR2G308_9ROSI
MKYTAVLSSESHEHGGSSSGKRKAGRKKFQETRHPIYKGVRRRNGKWVSELREPNKKSRIWLGTFSTPAMAAKAYDAAALALKGDSASFNFPDSAYALPRARSSSVRDIQCAAMEAASDAQTLRLCLPPLTCPEAEVWLEDEEEVFNMPGILEGMAEGLILTPPAMQKGYYNYCWDDHFVECNLWG